VDAAATDTALVAAEQYLDGKDPASAEMILLKLMEQAPGDHRVHELYGRVLYLKGLEAGLGGDDRAAAAMYEQAYGHYRTAVEAAAGQDPLVLAGLNQSAGEIASAAGFTERGAEHFRAAGRLDPTAAKHPLYEAQMLIQLKRPAEARLALERVLALDPDEVYAHASLAAAAVQEQDTVSALEHIQEARRIDPDNLGIRLQEARIRRLCGQPRRGLELLLATDEDLRAREPFTREIAACYATLGEPAKAAEAWERCFRRHPDRPGAWRAAVEAATARLEAGQRQEALQWYRQARLAAPDAAEVEALGQALQSAGGPEP
jgi:tetratricopeptide (TPR) repeat protein